MGERSKIEWTDATWNPTRGCRRISPGCLNCYAEHQAGRFCGEGQPFEGFVERDVNGRAFWTGSAGLIREKLLEPMSWVEPRRIFVDSMADLFYEGLDDEDIDRVFAVMLLTPRHTFQVLTKRSRRMRSYFNVADRYARILRAVDEVRGASRSEKRRRELYGVGVSDPRSSLPRNIWLGVSVEDQARAEERIPDLLDTPAAVKFLSCEPLLGPVTLGPWLGLQAWWCSRCRRGWELGEQAQTSLVPDGETRAVCPGPTCAKPFQELDGGLGVPRIDWVIVGGESGAGARPMRLEWAREILSECRAAGVPAFMKQMGSAPVVSYYDEEARQHYDDEGCDWPDPIDWSLSDGQPPPGSSVAFECKAKGRDPEEWPEGFRVRQFPGGEA